MLEIMKTKKGLIKFWKASRNFRSFEKYKSTYLFCTVIILHAIENSKINKSLYHILFL